MFIRPLRVIGGFTLLVAGVAMLALPGPGWLSIAAGLALLAEDFPWARRFLDRINRGIKKVRRPRFRS